MNVMKFRTIIGTEMILYFCATSFEFVFLLTDTKL